MSPALPDGDPVPGDGALPAQAATGAGERGFGVYVHVPFCRRRCGYCDFNTYVAGELPSGTGTDPARYVDHVLREIELSARVLGALAIADRPLRTVFFGGGTPTLLPAADLARLLAGLVGTFGAAIDLEVTTEANPDSVDGEYLNTLAGSGFTRVSLGAQSAVPHVLARLDRTHDPDRVGFVVDLARKAGLATSLDLIYGIPGESPADWRTSLDTAVNAAPDHISAYSLTVEDGTALGAAVRRGELPDVDGDDQAAKYELADEVLSAAGFMWYEISNWSRTATGRCRHNLAYWRGDDWWGYGPGAHSHVGGVRWWNVKHPATYADRLAAGASPGAGREILDRPARRFEQIMLGLRLSEGLPADLLTGDEAARATALCRDGLLTADGDRYTLTLRGRLLADTVLSELLDW